MAKTESTAVNELIALVSSQQGPADAGDDLMFSSPKPMAAARMTAPLPIIKGAAVPPLPRSRAPSGTQSQPLPTIRASTAPPPRGSTIPPLPRPSASITKPPQPTQRMNALPPPPGGFRTTQSRPSLPPPLRHSSPRPEGTPAPELFGRSGVSAAMPVAAPFEPLPRAKTPTPAPVPALDDDGVDSWFQSSYLVAKIDPKKLDESNGTYQVPRSATTIALIKKLIAPTALLVLVGVCIGGFLAFNGEGGRKHAASASPTDTVANAEPAAPAAAPAVAPTAAKSDDAKPDLAPAKPDVSAAKLDVAAKPEAPAAKPDVPAAKAQQPPPAPAKDAPKAVAAIDTRGLTTIKTTRGEVKLADIRFDSKPAGATVMLVDRGKTSFLGTTPVVASVDPSRAYDVVFTAASHPPQVEHLDPNVTHKLAIVLGKPGNQALAETAQPAQVAVHHHHHDAAKVVAPPAQPAAKEVKLEPKVEAPKAAAKVEAKVEAPKVAAKVEAKVEAPKTPAKVEAKVDAPKPAALAKATAPSGAGTLMVSSKPPCEIVIDGKPTGLTTPQRAIQLAPGAHKVTFVNAGESINKTVAVVINADKPTKLIQDLMKK